jgi:hypothetical protein
LARIGLPTTFQDAISIARNLHFRYLWIDALCIQHDDKDDFIHQINGMDRIYREAKATIVSVTSHADCLIPGFRIGSRLHTAPLVCDFSELSLFYAGPPLEDAIKNSAWESRGWTLQEKFFSKRLIFFTDRQVYFQCADAVWAEDVLTEPDSLLANGSSSVVARNEPPTQQNQEYHNDSRLGMLSQRDPLLPKIWAKDFAKADRGMTRLFDFVEYQKLLQEYLPRSLTRDDDILSAFTGILNSLDQTLGVSKSGLPRAVFDAALLWRGDRSATRRHGFPSWSWAGWNLGRTGGEISWLVIDRSHDSADDPWTYAAKNGDAERQLQFFGLYYAKPFTIPMPRLVGDTAEMFSANLPNQILTFEACAFWSERIVSEDDDATSILDSFTGSQGWGNGKYKGYIFQLIVMSGSVLRDTWAKRLNGTSTLPGAPIPFSGGRDIDDEVVANVNLMLVVMDRTASNQLRKVWRRLWVFRTSRLLSSRLAKMKRRVIRLQ